MNNTNLANYETLASRTCARNEDVLPRLEAMPGIAGEIFGLFPFISAYAQRADVIKKLLFYGSTPEGINKEALTRSSAIYAAALERFRSDPSAIRLLHAAIGQVTEAAEFLDSVCQSIFEGKDFDRANLLEEVGDGQWYHAEAVNALASSFAEVQRVNIEKLNTRYPDKFTAELAENRDLSKEREVLENGTKRPLRFLLPNGILDREKLDGLDWYVDHDKGCTEIKDPNGKVAEYEIVAYRDQSVSGHGATPEEAIASLAKQIEAVENRSREAKD